MRETDEQLIANMKAYPNKLNKYIHQESRDELIKRGKLHLVKNVDNNLNKLSSVESVNNNLDDFKRLKKKNMKELRLIAKTKKIDKYYDMKEDELIRNILSKK